MTHDLALTPPVRSFSAALGRSASYDRLAQYLGGRITQDALLAMGQRLVSEVPPEVVVEYLDLCDHQRRLRSGSRSALTLIIDSGARHD